VDLAFDVTVANVSPWASTPLQSLGTACGPNDSIMRSFFRRNASADRSESVKPRLLNLRQAAASLGCSFWTARDYVLQGLIPAVDMPPLRPRPGDSQRKTLRRVLVDRADLDAFIESRKRRDGGVIR
jgi:hypothetical protein